MKAPLLGMVLTLIAPMIAAELAPPPMTGLLPTELARPLLDQDPGVAAAQADLQVALHEAAEQVAIAPQHTEIGDHGAASVAFQVDHEAQPIPRPPRHPHARRRRNRLVDGR